MENQSSDSPMASSSSRPSPSSTNSTSSRFQLPPFKNFIDALTPSSSFRHLQLSAERDYGGRGAPDEPDDSGPNRLLNMLPVSVARPPSRTTSSHVRGRARTDSNASSSAPTLSHRYGSPPPSQPYSASASASASTSMMRMTAKGTNVIEDGTGMKTTRSDERQFQREREQQQQPQHYSLSDAPPPPPMTIPAQMNRDLFPPRRTYRRRSPSLQSHYERYPAASSSDEYHSSPAAGTQTQAQAQAQASPRSSSSSSHVHSASGAAAAASASTHSRLPPHHSEQPPPSLPPPPFPRPPFSPEHGVSHQRQTTSTSQSQSQTAEGARGARRDSSLSLSSSLTPYSYPPDGPPSTSGAHAHAHGHAHSAIHGHGHGMDLHSPPLPPPPSGAGAAQYQSRSHGLSSGSVSQLEPSPSSSPSGGGGGTAPHYLTTSQERVLPPRQNQNHHHRSPPHHPRGSGYPAATAPEPPAPPASPAAAGYGRGRGRDQPLARNRPPTDIGDRASVAVVRHRYDSPPLPWTSDTSHQRLSGMTYMEDERQSSSGGSGSSSRHPPASVSAPLESHPRDERRAKVAFQYEDAYNIIPGTSRQTVERDRSRSGTITGPSHRPLEESSSHLGPDRSSRPPPASSSTMSVDDARSSSSYAQSPGAGQSSVKAPFLREISGRENIAKGQMALNQLIRHKSKEDLSRVLTELSNEARYAVQEGNTLKKLQEFTYAICQFAAFYAHSEDQSGVTPEDVEEMTHRADLVHRMAQHLLVQMKENARPKKEEPVTFTSLKAKPKLTKSEQDTLDMMTEIARSRNFSKQGGKSKYQKRNVSPAARSPSEKNSVLDGKEIDRLLL
ncbi:hypothetical protein FRC16_011120 [Serendipita sp. 398]|nr:hypothetical protein FRC16_011120 [Serendipita sp. 398]